jgi:hypothetical protein
MHFLYSVHYELTAFTCFEHYLLVFKRRCINKNWYISCALCRLAATALEFHSNPQQADMIRTNIRIVVYALPPEDE